MCVAAPPTSPAHVVDAVHGGDVAEEGVAQALARRGALDQARNVNHVQERADSALGLVPARTRARAQAMSTSAAHAGELVCGLWPVV